MINILLAMKTFARHLVSLYIEKDLEFIIRSGLEGYD